MYRIYTISNKEIAVSPTIPAKELKLAPSAHACSFEEFKVWFPDRLTKTIATSHSHGRVFGTDTREQMYVLAKSLEDAGHDLVFATTYKSYDEYELESRTAKFISTSTSITSLSRAGYSRTILKHSPETVNVDFKSGDITIEHKTSKYHHVYSNHDSPTLTIYHDNSFTVWTPTLRQVRIELSGNYLTESGSSISSQAETLIDLKLISPVEALSYLPHGRLPLAAEIEQRLEIAKQESIEHLTQHTTDWAVQ